MNFGPDPGSEVYLLSDVRQMLLVISNMTKLVVFLLFRYTRLVQNSEIKIQKMVMVQYEVYLYYIQCGGRQFIRPIAQIDVINTL